MSFLFFTGAGVSVSAGIPDFRSGKGIFKMKLSKTQKSTDLFDASQVLQSHDTYLDWLSGMATLYECIRQVEPTYFHRFLVRLSKAGKLQRVYSQNIDELEYKAGLPTGKVILLHGTLHHVHCMVCGHSEPLQPHHSSFQQGQCVACTRCKSLGTERQKKRTGLREGQRVGTLRPSVLLYNEGNAKDITKQMRQDRRRKPTIVIIGTSLKVTGLKKAIKDISHKASQVWLVNPDKDLVIPSELKPVITKRWFMTADEFAVHMDRTVLKQRTIDGFLKTKVPSDRVHHPRKRDSTTNENETREISSKRLFV